MTDLQTLIYNYMRKALTVSLPDYLFDIIEEEIKKGAFVNRSEFFQHLIKHWQKGCPYQENVRRHARSSREIRKTQWQISMAGGS